MRVAPWVENINMKERTMPQKQSEKDNKKVWGCIRAKFSVISALKDSVKGIALLYIVIVVGGILLIVSIAVSLRSVGESDISFDDIQSNKAVSLANVCAEVATMKLLTVRDYAGSEILTINGDTCEIVSVSGSGNTSRVITVSSTVSTAVGNYTKKVKVNVSKISTSTQITSWQEVGSF
jgi:hypothetical protein